MSREQANTFKKYRDAVDVAGNLAWAARLAHKGVRQGPEAASRIDVEQEFELTDDEKIVWRLLRLPRKYMDIEHSGLMTTDKIRSALRGFVAADVVDIVELADAKALLPAEIKRVKAELAGKEVQRSTQPLRGRVYRPELDPKKPAEPAPEPVAAPVSASSPTLRAPPKTAAPVMSDDDKYYRDEIERAFIASSKQNHYEFLGLSRPSDDAAVRAAYVRLAREYHPDRVAAGALAQDETLKARVEMLFRKLGDAQAALATSEARQNYDRALDVMGDMSVGADGKRQRRPNEAKNAFLMAETYFKKKDFKQAEAHYRQANMFDGEDPKILTALAYCIWMNPDHAEATRTQEARKRFSDVVSQHRYGDAAYKLGLLLRKLSDEGGAQRQFALAHKLDPDHVEAQREVRLADSRHKKAVQDKKDANSILGKLGLKK